MLKTRLSSGRTAEIHVIYVTPAAEKPAEFHIVGEELTA
jgi:hypothetical protein